MLKQRLLTIVVLVPLLIGGLYYLPAYFLGVFGLLLLAWMAWEWSQLAMINHLLAKLIYVVVVVTLAYFLVNKWQSLSPGFLLVAALVWLQALWVVCRYRSEGSGEMKILLGWVTRALVGLVVMPALWLAWVALFTMSRHWLLYGLLIVWVADSAAYVGGRLWGRHALAPQVSPKKTWEGLATGLAACLALAWFGYHWLNVTAPLFYWLLVSGLAALMSVVGDLYESVFKRLSGVKDSGRLLPGHGGILDRMDAMLAALPCLVVLLRWWLLRFFH